MTGHAFNETLKDIVLVINFGEIDEGAYDNEQKVEEDGEVLEGSVFVLINLE